SRIWKPPSDAACLPATTRPWPACCSPSPAAFPRAEPRSAPDASSSPWRRHRSGQSKSSASSSRPTARAESSLLKAESSLYGHTRFTALGVPLSPDGTRWPSELHHEVLVLFVSSSRCCEPSSIDPATVIGQPPAIELAVL